MDGFQLLLGIAHRRAKPFDKKKLDETFENTLASSLLNVCTYRLRGQQSEISANSRLFDITMLT
jgi:hypothetical protein